MLNLSFFCFHGFQASDVRIIRVFISSTFTDTAQERNLLIADGSHFSFLPIINLLLLLWVLSIPYGYPHNEEDVTFL